MNRKWSLLGVLALGGMGIGVGVTEVLIRITGLATPPAVISANERQFASMPGVFVPRSTRTDRSSARFPYDITINSHGYRGKDFPARRTTEEFRILFVGDSFTWGDLVHDHETLPVRLQERLRRTCSGVHVINAGVGGTTIDAHRDIVARGLALQPDLVVLMFYDNDIAELSGPTFWEVMAENRRRKSQFPLSVVHLLLNRTATWTVMRRASTRIGNHGQQAVPVRDEEFWETSLQSHRAVYEGHLRSLATDLQNQGIPFVMLSYPSHLRMLEPTVSVDHAEWLVALTEEIEIPFLDLLPVLDASEMAIDELFFIPWDGHARPIGYDIASQRVSDELIQLDEVLTWCSR
jgi:hypothetical protein